MPRWLKVILTLVLIYAFLMYSTTLLDFNPQSYSVSLPEFKGSLETNDKLSKAELLYKGLIHGPESIIFHEGTLYTGIEDGRIVKIKGDGITTVAQIGTFCRLPYEEQLCGRPLGLRVGKDGLLYVVDGFYGIFSINFTTEALTRLLPSTAVIDGKKLTFLDDLDIDSDGNIYVSLASSKWDLSNIYISYLEHENSGSIVKYNVKTAKTEILVKDVYFPNGVQLSKDRNSILFSEAGNMRILRYYIKGPKKGQQEIFADRLPGEPDNIRQSSKGYWVALATGRSNSTPLIFDHLSQYSPVRRVWVRAQHALGTLLMAMSDIISYEPFKEVAYKLRRGDIFKPLISKHGIIIELDESGKIIRSLQDPSGKVSLLSQVTEHEGYLYLGSFINDYIGRIKL